MKKHTLYISLLLVGGLIELAGCSEKTMKEQPIEKKVKNHQVGQEKKDNEPAQLEKEQKPVVVNVLDQDTQKVVKTFIPKDMGFGKEDEKYKATIDAWAKAAARGSGTIPGYDQRMIPDRVGPNGQILIGKPRRVLNEAVLSERIIQASTYGGNVDLPIIVTASGYKPEEVPHLGEVVVASYSTRFSSSVAGRTKNIELSAGAINNVIIGNQDFFSFNTTVGPSDQAHGYQQAKEAVNGKLVDGIGGGICQTSSTLFNAVDQLRVSYVEKHHHSVHVGYVPIGRDATVSYGGPDFRFQNTTGIPLLIKAFADKTKGILTVELRTSQANQSLLKR